LFTSPVLRDPEAAILLGRLLLVFLCNSLGGHLVFKDVVQWLTPGLSSVMRLAFVLDGLENTILGRKLISTSSAEERKSRLLLIKEISQMLDDVKGEVTVEPSQGVAMGTQCDRINNSEKQVKDLLTRTEELIKYLQLGITD